MAAEAANLANATPPWVTDVGASTRVGLAAARRCVERVAHGQYLHAELHPHGFVSVLLWVGQRQWVDVNLWPYPLGGWLDASHRLSGTHAHRAHLRSWVVGGVLRHRWATTTTVAHSAHHVVELGTPVVSTGPVTLAWTADRTLVAPVHYHVDANEFHDVEPLAPSCTVALWDLADIPARLIRPAGQLVTVQDRPSAPRDLVQRLLALAQ